MSFAHSAEVVTLKRRIEELEALTERQVKRTGQLTGQVDSLLRRWNNIPWDEAKIACYEEFAEPEDRAAYAVRVLERILAVREEA